MRKDISKEGIMVTGMSKGIPKRGTGVYGMKKDIPTESIRITMYWDVKRHSKKRNMGSCGDKRHSNIRGS